MAYSYSLPVETTAPYLSADVGTADYRNCMAFALDNIMTHETFTTGGIAIDSGVVYALLLFAAFFILIQNNVYPRVVEILNCVRATFTKTRGRRPKDREIDG